MYVQHLGILYTLYFEFILPKTIVLFNNSICYAGMLMVGANAGIVGMTKEHLGLALALSVPVFVVVTKIDMCPPNVLQVRFFLTHTLDINGMMTNKRMQLIILLFSNYRKLLNC